MRTVIASLESASPYSQSRKIQTEKPQKELSKDFEKRIWRERCHRDDKGFVFIPAMAFKKALSEVAKYLSIQIDGKGKSTYTKHFEAGIVIPNRITLPIKVEDVHGEWVYVPSDGRRGGSKRVDKCFPKIEKWKGDLTVHILDDIITADVFEQHLQQAGSFIGIGRWRVRNDGEYGRFKVLNTFWHEGK